MRRAFQDLLGIYFQALIPICEAAKDTKDDITVDEFMGLHNWDDLSEQLSRRMARSDTTLGYLARIARAYWRESSDAHLVKYLRNFAKPICKVIPDTALQEYIVDIVEGCCLQGGRQKLEGKPQKCKKEFRNLQKNQLTAKKVLEK